MRVLLINPSYPFEEFPRLLVTLPYVASALRAEGHEVEILDLLLAQTTARKIEARMLRFRPQIVGITSVTLNHHIAEDIARWVRACDGAVPIVMGGPHVSFEIEGSFKSLDGALDYIAIGEGEHTMVELCRALGGRMDLRDVRGLAAYDRRTGHVGKNAPRPLEDDLDTIPDPARDLVPLSRYLAFDSHASVVTSRGCPYECIFCSAPQWTGRKVRYRNPSLCVDEIERLSSLGFTEITIEDDLFTLYRKHFLAVCGELCAATPGSAGTPSRASTRSARDRRDDGARRLPGDLLRRRERQPGGARPRQEELEPRQGEGGDAHDAGRRHQRAGVLHHRPARARPRRRCARPSSSRTSSTRSSARSTASTSWRPSRAPRCATAPRSTGSRS